MSNPLLLPLLLVGCCLLPPGCKDPAEPSDLVASLADETTSYPYFGDLWPSTWSADGSLYMGFGDGTGMAECIPSADGLVPGVVVTWTHVEESPGCFLVQETEGAGWYEDFCGIFDCSECHPLCPFTPAGLVALDGAVPSFDGCTGDDQCVVGRDLPDASAWSRWDKPSSLLEIGGRLVLAGHYPAGTVDQGYLAVSDDKGTSWTVVQDSPWGETSDFRVLMLINMGQGFSQDQDGWVYGMGIPHELDDQVLQPQEVALARAPKGELLDYTAWEYLSALDDDSTPSWSSNESDAIHLAGLETISQASAIYHPGLDRYLFLTGLIEPSDLAGALFEAENPWGPWREVLRFPASSIASLVPKGADGSSVYFTAAGGEFAYNLHLGRLDFEVD